jgi:hypothetical protein
VDIIKNAEVLYYMRNEDKIGINKNVSSNQLIFREITCCGNDYFFVVDGDIYPEKELPGKKTKRPCLR